MSAEAIMSLISSAAQPGDTLAALDTPSLILDLDAFEDNLKTMQALAEHHGVALRPHAKAHKCADIAQRQIALGAQGICCQKVTEAAAFIAAGITDIHISNEIVGASKIGLLARLAKHAQLSVCVDHIQPLKSLSEALVAQDAQMGIFVEIDLGQQRCGVQTIEEAVKLAQATAALPNVWLKGVQAYHGGIQHERSHEARYQASQAAAQRVQEVIDAIAKVGLECPVITGAGTGTALFDVASGVYTEIQPGSYAFMDNDYGQLEWGEGATFQHSLFVLGTVMSVPTPTRAIVDVGLKSTTAESGLPRPYGLTGVTCTGLHDEHTMLDADKSVHRPPLGSLVKLVPGHCDPTFNLHDTVVVMRGDTVEALWPITARGLSR